MDLYEIIGVDKDSTLEEITLAYKKKAIKLHPDKNLDKDTTKEFQELNQAYEVLKDVDKRAHYDLTGTCELNSIGEHAAQLVTERFMHHCNNHNFKPENYFVPIAKDFERFRAHNKIEKSNLDESLESVSYLLEHVSGNSFITAGLTQTREDIKKAIMQTERMLLILDEAVEVLKVCKYTGQFPGYESQPSTSGFSISYG